VKENARAAEQIRHIWLLLGEELLIRNGITISSKKIVGYAEDVTGTFCIERLYLQFTFAEVFVWPRIVKRVCRKCGGKTTTQKSKTSPNDYHIWHRHAEVLSKWLCGRCYANWLFDPRRRFKTKEERYQYISKLFSGAGNPQYGNHTLNVGRDEQYT